MTLRALAILALVSALFSAPASAQGSPLIVDTGSVFYIPFNDTPLTSIGAGPTLTLNGDVYFSSPNLQIDLGSSATSVTANLKAGFALEIEADQGGTFEKTLPLGEVPIYFFYFPAFPQITGQVVIAGALAVEGEIEAGMRTGFVGQFELGAMIGFSNAVEVDPDFPDNVAFELSPPEFTGNTALDLSVAFEGGVYVEFSFNGIPVSKPYVKVSTGVEITVDPAADPWWDADAFIAPSAGWDFIFLPPLEGRTRGLTWDLADAGGPIGGPVVPSRWARAYDSDDVEELRDLKPFQTGFIAVGKSDSNNGWIAALDARGEVLWEKRAQNGTDTGMRPKEVHVTRDGGIVVGGTPSASGVRIDRYDSLGNPLWTRGFVDPGGDNVTLESLITTSDGGLAFAGNVERPAGGSMMIAKLDLLGEPEWSVEYEPDATLDAEDAHAVQLVETTDGRFLAVGDALYQNAPSPDHTMGNRCAALLMVDAAGQFEWATVIGGIGPDQGVGVAEVSDGDFVLVGHVHGEGETPWTARVDGDGNLLWSRTLGSESLGGNDRARDVIRVPGGALVAGTSSHGPSEDGWLARIDQDGDVVWFKSVLGPDEDELMGILRLPTGYVAWGQTRSLQPLGQGGDEADMWILRGPHDGMLHFDSTFGLDVHNDMRASSGTVFIVYEALPGTLLDMTLLDDPRTLLHDLWSSIVTLLTE